MNRFFIKDIANAAKNYPPGKVVYIIEQLRVYDLKSKGKNNATTTNESLFKELLYKILH
jgi:DNA polymerase-3 subunit delta